MSPAIGARESAGVTLAARGDVEAYDLLEEVSRSLSRRSEIFNVDSIFTGADSQAQIRMLDDAVVSVRSDTELVIAEYQYDAETGEGRAAMELVSGGLRALTGSIDPDNDDSDFEVRTSVGSIGIRGTHFEAIQRDANVLLGVWDGEVQLDLDVDPGGDPVVLGGDQDYSFASVDDQGQVTFFLEPPAEFESGHTDDDEDPEGEDGAAEEDEEIEEEETGDEDAVTDEDDTDEDDAGDDEDEDADPEALEESVEEQDDALADDDDPSGDEPSAPASPGLGALAAASQAATGEDQTAPQVINPINVPTPPNVIADRSGTARYQDLLSVDLAGNRTDFEVEISFEVNFSQGTVDDGEVNLTAEDGVAWLGLFSGGITDGSLEIGPTIGENLFNQAYYTASDGSAHDATGSLSGTFFGSDAEQVRGDFSFERLDDDSVWVSGDFRLGVDQ